MGTNKICPNCRKPLPPDVPMGLCPECLIKSGFQTGTEPGVTGQAASGRFVPPPVEEIARLFPQLEILGLIGKGGMGAVYKARQPALDRFVALKVLPPAVASDPGFAERFNREACALARLNHPNIVAVHDFGKAGTLHYLLMEFVDGTNLREVERAGRLSTEQALAIVPQICEALQAAHNEGIVHRDIKPENILLDKKGRVKITDFGIAKIVGVPTGKASLTGLKDVMGTPHYMAPEQIEKPLEVDCRADIYSLGVVFYEMLTGELPLGNFQPPSQKVQVDVRLDEVVLHALAKEPERRYQHASVLKTDVDTIAGTPPQSPIVGRSASAKTATPKQQHMGRIALRLCVGGLALPMVLDAVAHVELVVLIGLFLVCEIAALVIGIIGWRSAAGKAAVIIAPLLLFLSVPIGLFVAYSSIHSTQARVAEDEQVSSQRVPKTQPVASASTETWSPKLAPGEKPDVQKILSEAKDLMSDERYEEALQRHIWYHNHALKFDRGQSGVRLSSALSDWVELGRRYPKAKQALIEIRDHAIREFQEGRGYSELFQETASINDQLQNNDATYTLFKSVEQRDPHLARQCYFYVENMLAQKGEYETCWKYMGDPQFRFESIRSGYEMEISLQKEGGTNAASPPDVSAVLKKSADDRFVGQTRQLIEILVATGQKTDAEKIRDEAVAVLNVPELQSAVSDAESRIQKRNAVRTSAEQPQAAVETQSILGGRGDTAGCPAVPIC